MTAFTFMWNVFVLVMAGYIVFWRGKSGWWLLPAFLLLRGD